MTESTAAPAELETLPRWVPPLVFALLTAVVFRAYLLSAPGQMLLGQDTIGAGIMFRNFFVQQFQQLHRLPLWNPYVFGGVPTIEGGSGDILYPAGWLHFILPLTSALAWKLILHVFLAGVFMHGAARAFGASRWVALLAGSTYLLSPNLVSPVWGGQDGKIYVFTLFPLALGLLVRALRDGSLIRFLWLGFVAGLMLLAHPQVAYYAYVALGIYALVALIAGRGMGGRAVALRAAAGGVSLVIALAIAAVVLLPMYRYLREDSPRAGPGLGFEKAASYDLNAEEMASFLVPDFSGVNERYWGKNPLKHNTEYGGVLVVGLGLAGILALTGDRRRWGLGIMAALALLYAMGDSTPAFRLMYLTIPGLKNFRAPSLATFISLTALTLLAVLLLERMARDRAGREGRIAARVLGTLGVAALVLGLLLQAGGTGGLRWWFALFGGPMNPGALEANLPRMVLGSMLAAVWCGLAAVAIWAWRRGLLGARGLLVTLALINTVDTLRVDAPYIEVVNYDDFFPPDGGIEALRQQLGPGQRVLAFPGVFPTAGHLATYGIPQVFGYHGNQLRWYDELTRRARREGARTSEEVLSYWQEFINGPMARLLAARVVIVPPVIRAPGLTRLGGDNRLAVYGNPRALGEATVVPRVTMIADTASQLDRVWDSTFAPEQEALVFEPQPELGEAGGTGSATISGDGADSVAVTAQTSGPAMLLLSRNWHPSWQATVDGRPARVVRTDYALLGVPLPAAGTHAVVLRYRPAIVTLARRISIAGWLTVVAGSVLLLILERRRRTAGA